MDSDYSKIFEKLTHLGFEADAVSDAVYKRPGLEEFYFVVGDERLEIHHGSGPDQHIAVLNLHSAIVNNQVENHVRGVVAKQFGYKASQEVEDFPDSINVHRGAVVAKSSLSNILSS